MHSMTSNNTEQDERYREVAAEFGPALVRLARAWEADADARQDLLQEIHFALWRSLAAFDGRCGLRTWVYRVAQNAATSHVLRSRRAKRKTLVSLEELEEQGGVAAVDANHPSLEQAQMLDRLYALIQTLRSAGPAGDPALPGGRGRRCDRRSDGHLAGIRGHQDPPRQGDPCRAVPQRRKP